MTGPARYGRLLAKRERVYHELVCPTCGESTKVIDSRGSRGAIRRRRECLNETCKYRFTTYEAISEQLSSRTLIERIMQLLAPIVSDTVREALNTSKKV